MSQFLDNLIDNSNDLPKNKKIIKLATIFNILSINY